MSISQSSEPKPLMHILVQHRSVTITKQTMQKNMVTAKSMRHCPSNVLEAMICWYGSRRGRRGEDGDTTKLEALPLLCGYTYH